MPYFNCDRCGCSEDFEFRVRVKIDTDTENLYTMFLCDNCFQTIKEVLEDGQIK